MLPTPALAILVVLAQPPKGPPKAVTAGQIAEKLKALTEANAPDDRRTAAGWFAKHAADPAIVQACKPLEHAAAFDDAPEVRGYAVWALGRIAVKNQLPCPQIILDALFDREPDADAPDIRLVPNYATLALHEFQSPPPALLPAILRLLRSPDPSCRADGVGLVNIFTRGGVAARKLLDSQPAVAKLVASATRDAELEVRRVAIYTHFELTNDTAAFLCNAMRHQDDVVALPALPGGATDIEKRKRAGYNLGAVSVAMLMTTRIQESPDEVRDGFRKLLAAREARTRGLAAEQLGRMAAGAEAELGPESPGSELDAKRMRANTLLIVTDPGIRDRLTVMVEKDDDDGVRSAAKTASLRIASLSERK